MTSLAGRENCKPNMKINALCIFFTIETQSTKFSRSSQPLFQHADSKNSYKIKRLVEFQQISLFDARVFALFGICFDCHLLVVRKLFLVRAYLIGLN